MSNSRLNRFLNGKGFYVALGICMIAIGVSAWAAIDKASTPPDDILSSDTAQIVSEESSSFETEANKEQEGVEDERDESSATSEVPTDDLSSDSAPLDNLEQPVAESFVFPVEGEVIKKFSATELQFSATFNDMRLHTGVDIKADKGSAVKSAGDGTVVEVVNDLDFGYTVRIDHGNGVIAAYGGLEKEVLVKTDDIVSAETVLGTLGTVNNECLDAPHLHLEFLKDGENVDPLDYIN